MTPPRKAYFPRATEDEYLAIRRWYAEEARDIADAFHAEVMRAVGLIEQFPEASPLAGGGIRKKVLRTPFPYAIFYTIESDRIRIMAVAHQSREPGYWTGRSSE